MNAVLLDGAGYVDQVFVDHRDECDAMFGGEVAKDLVEGLDVVGAIIGRQGDAGKEDLDVRGLQCGEEVIKVLARLIGGYTPKAIVTAKFDENHSRTSLDDRIYVGDRIFGGGAAGAAVLHLVFVAALVEIALQCVRKGLAGLKTVAGRDAVAVADDGRPIGGEKRNSRKYQANGNEKPTLYVHMISVKVCKARNAGRAACVRMKKRTRRMTG
jgi:hypothetical protein